MSGRTPCSKEWRSGGVAGQTTTIASAPPVPRAVGAHPLPLRHGLIHLNSPTQQSRPNPRQSGVPPTQCTRQSTESPTPSPPGIPVRHTLARFLQNAHAPSGTQTMRSRDVSAHHRCHQHHAAAAATVAAPKPCHPSTGSPVRAAPPPRAACHARKPEPPAPALVNERAKAATPRAGSSRRLLMPSRAW